MEGGGATPDSCNFDNHTWKGHQVRGQAAIAKSWDSTAGSDRSAIAARSGTEQTPLAHRHLNSPEIREF